MVRRYQADKGAGKPGTEWAVACEPPRPAKARWLHGAREAGTATARAGSEVWILFIYWDSLKMHLPALWAGARDKRRSSLPRANGVRGHVMHVHRSQSHPGSTKGTLIAKGGPGVLA